MRKHLATGELTDVHNEGEYIFDMAVLNDKLLIIDRDGMKSVPKDASDPVASQRVETTGLDMCTTLMSIHVVNGKKFYI